MKTLEDVVKEIAKGNFGALRVCCELLDSFDILAQIDFEVLLNKGIVGSEVWNLYKSCNSNLDQFHTALMNGTATALLASVRGSSFYQSVGK